MSNTAQPSTVNLAIPPLPDELRGAAWDRLRELIGERSQVQRQAALASRDQAGLPVELGRARRADQAAAAAAFRAGKPDPGPVEERKAEAAAADVQRRRSAARQAIASIERDIAGHVGEHVGEFRAAAAERLIAEQVEAADLAEAIRGNAHRQAQLLAVAAWVEAPEAKLRAGRTAAVLQRLDEVVAEVATLAPPARREPVDQTIRITDQGPTHRAALAANRERRVEARRAAGA